MSIEIGFMQGRLSEMINGKIQSFPKENWQNEFEIANSIGIKLMEWTIDYENNYQNPLFLEDGQMEIIELSKKYSLKIPSLTGDCFMQKPFWKESNKKERDGLISYMKRLFIAASKVGIKFIIIPIIDNGRIENDQQENLLIKLLLNEVILIKNLNLKIIFESDLSPVKYLNLINKFPEEIFGINYDTGNSASLGFNPIEEFENYGHRIMNVHIKDRLFKGTTVPIFQGSVDFDLIFNLLAKINYDGNIILQTARSKSNNHVKLIKDYKKLMENFINNYS